MKVRQWRAGQCLWRGCFWKLHGQYVGNQLNRCPPRSRGAIPLFQSPPLRSRVERRIALHPDRLTVEYAWGSQLQRVEFRPQWVRVGRQAGGGSLVELSRQGRRVAVGRYVRSELRPLLARELQVALRRSTLGSRMTAE